MLSTEIGMRNKTPNVSDPFGERTQSVSLLDNAKQTLFGRQFGSPKLTNQYDVMGQGEPSAVSNSQLHYGADIKSWRLAA